MEFSLQDIALLYGEEIYLLPDYVPEALPVEAAEAPLAVQASLPVQEIPVKVPVNQPVIEPVVERLVVEKPVAEKPVAPPPVMPVSTEKPVLTATAVPVAWKLRPTSRFALVMTETEFARKLLTSSLRVFVESAKIPLEQTGFGVIPDASTAWTLADAPVPVIVMLVPRPEGWQAPAGKTVYFADRLTGVIVDPVKEQQLAGILQEVLRTLTH